MGWTTFVTACLYGHGALMAENLLNSSRAIRASIYVIRAFVQLRQVLAAHKDLAKKLDELERNVAGLILSHDALATQTRTQFKQVVEALRELMAKPEPTRRPIGFVVPR